MPQVLILASASPRRRELLAALGVPFAIRPAEVDEEGLAAGLAAEEAVARVAEAKARRPAPPGAVVLAADTVVVLDGRLLGKPAGEAEARAMLRDLCERWHTVLTAVTVAADGDLRTVVRRSDVRMRGYRDTEIDAYVRTGAALDKAGAYGVQDETFRPVAQLVGCRCNVMGLPLWTVWRMLNAVGISPPRTPAAVGTACRSCPWSREAVPAAS